MDILVNRRSDKKIGNIQCDAVLNESQSYRNLITQYPIEGGQNTGANIRPEPERIVINGVITNSPLNNGVEPLVNPLNSNRALLAYNEFLKYGGFNAQKVPGEPGFNTGDPVLIDIIANLRVFTSMALESFEPQVGRQNELRFTATFVKFDVQDTEFVTVERVKSVGRAQNMKSRIQNRRNIGKDITKPPTVPQSAALSLIRSLTR